MVPFAIRKAFVQGVGDPLIALALIRRAAASSKRRTELQGCCRDEPPSNHDQFECASCWPKHPKVIASSIVASAFQGRASRSS